MSSSRGKQPFDPAPVLEIVTHIVNPEAHEHSNNPLFLPDRLAADLLGVSKRTLARWRSGKHRLSVAAADRVAVRLGRNPIEIWPDFHEVVDVQPGWREQDLRPCR